MNLYTLNAQAYLRIYELIKQAWQHNNELNGMEDYPPDILLAYYLDNRYSVGDPSIIIDNMQYYFGLTDPDPIIYSAAKELDNLLLGIVCQITGPMSLKNLDDWDLTFTMENMGC